MPSYKLDIKCKKGHKVFHACYRDSETIKRIKDLFYCPGCNEFTKLKAESFEVVIN